MQFVRMWFVLVSYSALSCIGNLRSVPIRLGGETESRVKAIAEVQYEVSSSVRSDARTKVATFFGVSPKRGKCDLIRQRRDMNLSRTTITRFSSILSTLAFRETMLPTSGMFSILVEGSTLFCSREKKT